MEKTIQQSPQYLRKRKFLLVLPLLVLPFLSFAFWALGGGSVPTKTSVTAEGLQTQLPVTQASERPAEDKMSFYAQADKDSLQLLEMKRLDPYYKDSPAFYPPSETAGDPHEQQAMEKLQLLHKAIDAPSPYPRSIAANNTTVASYENASPAALSTGEPDPEMAQINGALEKILDIQHPERVKEKTRQLSLEKRTQVFSLSAQKEVAIELLSRDTSRRNKNDFYGTAEPSTEISRTLSIPAVIHEAQTLRTGSTVKLRLLTDVFIKGVLIPKNSFAYGIASVDNERLTIKIENLQYHNDLFPVDLSAYDMDGIAGIHIPGSVNRDVAKSTGEQSLQSIELLSMDPSLKAQAAAAGINAAKGLFTKKIKQVNLFVKANYKLLLKDNHQQNL